ncbi:MAG: TAXI family TRAP transporter solute-binding subunit [Alphaproteobacteria bacterium]|tara:strand:- start:2663 stop:3658 length:996 start_codon:yes stop_codon:yes gene_type:complete
MKRWIKSIVAVMAASFVFAGVASAQEMKFFRIGTGGAGGTYFPIGGLIANAISSPPGARSCEKGGTCGVPGLVAIAVSTNASVFNMNAVQAGNLEAGLAGAQSVTQGYEGTGKFNGDKKDKVRIIANLYPEDMHLVLPKGEKLGSLKDLEGMSVGVASAGSGTQVSVKMILDHYGINVKENELGLNQSAQRLADGQLDAFFYAGGTPFAALIQLGSSKGFELYNFSASERKEINKIIPYYVESMIPAGTYETIGYDVATVAVNGQLITSVDQPDDLIYGITKALWSKKTRSLLDKGHSKGKAIMMETALKGVLIPVHPGAIKFYKEQGMIK